MSRLFTGRRLFAAHLLLVGTTLASPYLSRFLEEIIPNNVVAQVESREGESSGPSSAQKRAKVVENLCHSEGYIHTNETAEMMRSTLIDCAGSVSPSDVYLPVQGKTMSCGDLADAHEELNYHRQSGDNRIQLANRHTGQGWETTQGMMVDISELVKEFNRCADLNSDIFVPGFEVDQPVVESGVQNTPALTEPSTTASRSLSTLSSTVTSPLERMTVDNYGQLPVDVGQFPVDIDHDGRYDTTVSGVSEYVTRMSRSVCPEVLQALRGRDQEGLTGAVKKYFIRKHEQELEQGPKVFEFGLSTLYDTLCPNSEPRFRQDFYKLLTGQEEDMVIRMKISKLSSETSAVTLVK